MTKIYVPEIEAVGLKVEQKVDIKLHAFADTLFSGTISMISKTAQPKKRDNPVKYFIITVIINEKDESKLLPGQRLDATMYTAENKNSIVVPIQTIFREKGKSWVYQKKQDGGFRKKDVLTGTCSNSQCVVTSGLQANDVIALTEPQQSKEQDS